MAWAHIGTTASTVNNTGLSATVALHGSAVAGQLAVLGVMHRSVITGTTGITGWTLVDTGDNSDLSQQESVYYKILDASDITAGSVTVNQTSSVRIEIAVSVFSFGSATISVQTSVKGNTAATDDVITLNTPTVNNVLAVAFYSSWASNTSPTTSAISFDANMTLTVGAALVQRRHGAAYRLMAPGQDRTVTGQTNVSGSALPVMVVVLFVEDIASTARVSQYPVLALVEDDGTAQVSSMAALVLWGLDSTAQVSSMAALVLWGLDSTAQVSQMRVLALGRLMSRRIIGITD